MKINPDMIVLAREYRNFTQKQLARKLLKSQATIAKLEGGIILEIDDHFVEQLSHALNFPEKFFYQDEDFLGFGSSAYFYRSKTKISAADRKYIHSAINLLRIHLKKFLDSVEIEPKRDLPRKDIEDFGGSAEKAAVSVRSAWGLPDGAIKNLTRTVESTGVIIIPMDFKTRHMHGTCMRLTEMPPIIFINTQQSADRYRFTLAHELAHLVLHEVPHEKMEDEADQFASEFLMPANELAPQFARISNIRLVDLMNLKSYWKCSMQALLYRANELGFLTDNQNKYLWSQISKQGWRLNEPNPVEQEESKTYYSILKYFKDTLKFSKTDFASLLNLHQDDLTELYASLFPVERKPGLRLVL